MMQLGHVLYKTTNLKLAVETFRKKGFRVEFGSNSKPHNALIYFSEGPYIELLEKAPIARWKLSLLRLLRKAKVAERLEQWEKADEGFFEICLETYENNFKRVEEVLVQHKQSFFVTQSKRLDPQNRQLRWKLLFPYELQLPFMMTYFNIDPKPADFVHPNGIRKIKSVRYSFDSELSRIFRLICTDSLLELNEKKTAIQVFYTT